MYPVLSGGGGQIKKYVYVVLYEEIQMKKKPFLNIFIHIPQNTSS